MSVSIPSHESHPDPHSPRIAYAHCETLPNHEESYDQEMEFIGQYEDYGKLDIPLISVCRTDHKLLKSLTSNNLPRESQKALRYFLWRLGKSEWMQSQEGFADRAGIAIASNSDFFDGISLCRCSQGNRLCKMPDFCPRCNLDQRVEPALAEYGEIFEKAPFWAILVASSSAYAESARLKLVTKKDQDGKPKRCRSWTPWAGQADWQLYSLDYENQFLIEEILTVPFEFAKRLKAAGLIDGAYVAREIDLDFYSQKAAPDQLSVVHTALPHGNLLVNTRQTPDWSWLIDVFDVYLGVCWAFGVPAYSDLLGSRIDSQAEINRWISYELKPLPYHVWYNSAVTRGCNVAHLNMALDDVFDDLFRELSFARSPRKIGNMYCQSRDYLRQSRLFRLLKWQINLWLENEAFAAQHPEWEESVVRAVEKRQKRRGQRPRGPSPEEVG